MLGQHPLPVVISVAKKAERVSSSGDQKMVRSGRFVEAALSSGTHN
jgi:hypothetical protein